jgi:hypothetical protein
MPKSLRFKDTLYSADFLRQRYVVDDRNASQIAAEIGCTPGAVLDALRRFEIPVKTMSEVISKIPHLGSHASRVKQTDKDRFGTTLYSEEWVKVRAHLNASEIAREAGSSVPAAQDAMAKFGLTPPGISNAKAGRPAMYKRKGVGEPTNRTTSSRRAHSICPPGLCVVCGGEGEQINHIDRNWQNNDPTNLERMCDVCHRRQYAVENQMLFDRFVESGASFVDLTRQAHERLKEGKYAVTMDGPGLPGALTIEGETHSLSEWALRSGLREATLRTRLKSGWDPKRAISERVHTPEAVTVDGVTATITQHALRYGIAVGNVYSRLKSGWSLEKALKTAMRDPLPPK